MTNKRDQYRKVLTHAKDMYSTAHKSYVTDFIKTKTALAALCMDNSLRVQ